MSQGIVEQPSQQNSESQGKLPGPNRSQLVQRLLDQTASLPGFIRDLLNTQAVTVAGTEAAGFLIERGGEGGEDAFGLRPIEHIRPDQSTPEVRAAAVQAFAEIVRPCVAQGKDGAIEVGRAGDSAETQFCLVTLLRSEGQVVAVSAVVTRCMNKDRAVQRLSSMQLVAGYFELFSLRRTSEQNRAVAQSHQHVLQLATAAATAEGFQSAANNLCNELANRAHASRVSLGWVKGRNVKVKALSHTEQFDKKQELIVGLEKAMEECIDQDAVVQFDPGPDGKNTDNVTRAHAALSRAQGNNIVLSLPLRRKDEVIGVVTLEFLPGSQLGPQVANGLSVAVELLAPQLYDRYQNDRWLITKMALSAHNGAKVVMGPKHMLAKLVFLLVGAAVLVIWNVPYRVYPKTWAGAGYLDMRPMYRVSAPFQFAAQGKRVVCAPYEGRLGRLALVGGKMVEPGTRVKAGDLLIEMDTTQTRLDRAAAKAEANKARQEWVKAKGENKGAEANIALAAEKEALAKVALYDDQLKRAKIVAPVDGVVLSGDLETKQDSPVKTGDPLFEIGPENDLKVEMSVNERDIQELQVGQTGKVATTSLPTEKYGMTVDRIVPAGKAKEGSNVFTVYATLHDKPSPDWRPGLAGEARVDVEPRTVAWIWTHRLVEFVRLKLWM